MRPLFFFAYVCAVASFGLLDVGHGNSRRQGFASGWDEPLGYGSARHEINPARAHRLHAARALRVARAVDTGTLSINSNSSVRVTTPFGGFKQSGLGRELGPHALEHYTELKNVFMSTT